MLYPYLEVTLNSVKNPYALQFFCPVDGTGLGGGREAILSVYAYQLFYANVKEDSSTLKGIFEQSLILILFIDSHWSGSEAITWQGHRKS